MTKEEMLRSQKIDVEFEKIIDSDDSIYTLADDIVNTAIEITTKIRLLQNDLSKYKTVILCKECKDNNDIRLCKYIKDCSTICGGVLGLNSEDIRSNTLECPFKACKVIDIEKLDKKDEVYKGTLVIEK